MGSIQLNKSNVTIEAIKAFSDNYIWAISDSKIAVLVDPGDAEVYIDYLEKSQLRLSTILITHHHADHTGGINQLVDYCQQKQWPLAIYGPAGENIPQCNYKVSEKDCVTLPELGINFTVIDLPGHTAGHIAYFANNELNKPVLFCGDTLFSAGCGRLFEGTPKQMLSSLTKLANLPDQTLVYCTHEYTQANLKFARVVDPNNEELTKYDNQVNELRALQKITLPSTIEREKKINPFLRSHEQTIQASAQVFDSSTLANELGTFTTIRRWKDQF